MSTAGAIIRRIPYVPEPQDNLVNGVDPSTGPPSLGALDFLPDGSLSVGVERAQYCQLMFLIDPMTAQTATEGRRTVAPNHCATSITQSAEGILVGVAGGGADVGPRILVLDPVTLSEVDAIPIGSVQRPDYPENLHVSSEGVVLGDRSPVGSNPLPYADSQPFYRIDRHMADIPLGPLGGGTRFGASATVLGWWPGS